MLRNKSRMLCMVTHSKMSHGAESVRERRITRIVQHSTFSDKLLIAEPAIALVACYKRRHHPSNNHCFVRQRRFSICGGKPVHKLNLRRDAFASVSLKWA